jgi:hypothetical protein
VRVGWQARILEIDDGNTKFYLHPYKAEWVPVMARASTEDPWTPLPGYEGWDPVKYLIAYGARRSQILLGMPHWPFTRWNGLRGVSASLSKAHLTQAALDLQRLP